MPKTAEERYMEWLARKEEELSVGKVARLLTEWGELEAELSAEAHRPVGKHEVEAFMQWGKARYEILPEIGITTFWAPMFGGRGISYYDIARRRIIGYSEVTERIREYWAEWGY